MKIREKAWLVAASILVGALPSEGLAQAGPSECTCMLPVAAVGDPVGVVSNISGNVMISEAAGYGPAKDGAAIVSGSKIVVGPDSSASLRFGTLCSVAAPAGTSVAVEPRQSGICVRRTTAEAADFQPNALGELELGSLAAVAFGLAVVGAGTAVIVDIGEDDSLSD